MDEDRTVDLHEYVWRHFPEAVLSELATGLRVQVEAERGAAEAYFRSWAEPGDEWVEWSHLLHPLCGFGGLKLMRGGVCVKTWILWVA